MNDETRSLSWDDLLGVWESFRGDDIHGWHHRAIVFRSDGLGLWMEYWVPPVRHSRKVLKLFGPLPVMSVSVGPTSTTLIVDHDRPRPIEISSAADGAIFLSYPETTAGGVYYRRAKISVGRDGRSAVVLRLS